MAVLLILTKLEKQMRAPNLVDKVKPWQWLVLLLSVIVDAAC
jgi:hypothetical protein